MKTILTILTMSVALFAADASKPVLSPADKLDIRELQLKGERLQRNIQDLQKQIVELQGALTAKIKAATPKGYQITEDQAGELILMEAPKETPKPEEKKK